MITSVSLSGLFLSPSDEKESLKPDGFHPAVLTRGDPSGSRTARLASVARVAEGTPYYIQHEAPEKTSSSGRVPWLSDFGLCIAFGGDGMCVGSWPGTFVVLVAVVGESMV